MGYRREFAILGTNRVFSFPCDKNGKINTRDKHFPEWKENMEDCFLYPEKFLDKGIVKDGVNYCILDLPVKCVREYLVTA